ncbi:MAG: RsmF rRNA methyltransferase first C-terminal domain-containing protein [Defluviitaleaceae bacterium]|nr:RsmF rRNA methyltransferase first C-terminal domain-containing protein [Defluviitaleaceae bacterium]
MKFPSEFSQSMKDFFASSNYGSVDDFFQALDGKREYGLRVNTLKVEIDFLRKFFPNLEKIDWCDTGFYYDKQATSPLGKNPLYNAGLYYIQEPSAMSAAAMLNVQKGDKVLDLCASPGGKSTQIAAKLDGTGFLLSNDANMGRIPQLVRNIEMAGITNSIITCETPERLATRFTGYFDKILVDAPCSGEGMFRKDPTARLAWDVSKPARLAVIQKGILREASKMLTSGGFIVYSTCTFNRIENEGIIDDFLQQNPDFKLIEIKRIFPHLQRGEGHFVAVLRRNQRYEIESQNHDDNPNYKHSDVSKNADFIAFSEKYGVVLPNLPISQHKDRLYIAPQYCPDIAGLRVIRVGLSLGILKKNRFEPSYALAMALRKDNFAQAIDLPLEHSDIQRFLRNETFEIDAKDGYNLFCVEGFPLGFGKVLNGRLKNRIN